MFSSSSKSGATHINSQSKSPTVATSTPTTALTTTKPWPSPPPTTTITSFLPDRTNTLGLHNILLIAPPPSSFDLQQPPINSSAHHHHQIPPNTINHQYTNTNPNDQDSWTSIKKHQRDPNFAKISAFNVVEGGDDHNGSSYSTLRVCKDCGNRAKKECEYRRCRTCCKSQGYDCATHVKSTWVPEARRREKHGGCRGVGGSSGSSSGGGGGVGGKRPKENVTSTSNSFGTSNANAAVSFTFDTGSSYQDKSFKQSLPGQVRAPAVFRCIRVTAINSGEAEVAYQAIVNICGHVFKGFLYDQGIDEDNAFPCISKMQSTGTNRASAKC